MILNIRDIPCRGLLVGYEEMRKEKMMDAEALKRAMDKTGSDINSDIFSIRPQCGIRISERDYQCALHAVQNNMTQPYQSIE